MSMATRDDARSLIGAEVHDRNGIMIGRIAEVYVDEGTDNASWILLPAGLHRSTPTLAPLDGATTAGPGRSIQLTASKEQIDSAPPLDGPADQPVPAGVVEHLQSHYRPPAEDAMTRSEERLRVGTEAQPSRRVRLVKYIDTENVQVTVPVRREKVRLEEVRPEEVTGDGPAGEDAVPDTTLHEERLVIGKQTVPVERVRLTREVKTDVVPVEEQLRKERIEVEHPGGETEQLG
jgi:uncharacterized protein (TIGR02271 family)